MNAWPSETTSPSTGESDCGDDKTKKCNVAGYDDLSCAVDGIAAEAEYLKKYKDKIIARRAKFDQLRVDYQKMRSQVEPTIDQLKKDLADPDAALCQVAAGQRKCLRDAWNSVKEELDACSDAVGGWCVSTTDATFDAKPGEKATVPEIQALIVRYEDQVGRVEGCFDKLAGEPAALKDRVDKLTALVQKIKDNKVPQEAFAQMLWGGYLLAAVDGGFATAAAFENCLCIALNASLAGRQKLASLTGRLTVLTCQAKAHADRCTWLRGHVVDEIVNRCLQTYASSGE